MQEQHRTLTQKAALLRFFVAGRLAGGAEAVCGQSADCFAPKTNSDLFIVVQLEGNVLIGDVLTNVSPNCREVVTRNRIARLNPDGPLDPAFNPNANSNLYSIAMQAHDTLIPILPFAVHCFYCLQGHIRERAPPFPV